LTLAAAATGLWWIGESRQPAVATTVDRPEAPIAGYTAPSFSLTSTLGDEVTLAGQRGRPVVLKFWASWCAPCLVEMPHFQKASLTYRGRAAILGINQGEPAEAVAEFGGRMALSYPLLPDPTSQVSHLYGVTALPTTVFVDSRGVVREVFLGILNEALLEDRVERLLSDG
jgi:peroxiredoxin